MGIYTHALFSPTDFLGWIYYISGQYCCDEMNWEASTVKELEEFIGNQPSAIPFEEITPAQWQLIDQATPEIPLNLTVR